MRTLLRGIGVVLLLAAVVAGIAWHDTVPLGLKRETTSSPKLTRELRILQVTDLHDWRYTDQLPVLERYLRETRPDVIAVTGDLLNTATSDRSRVRRWLDVLVASGAPVYVVDGNHDHWNNHLAHLHTLYSDAGVHFLDQQTVPLDGPWGRVDLIGADDYYSHHGDLAQAMRGVRAGTFRLLLTHSPEVRAVLPGSGVDVALCGHTHGGQIRLPLVGAANVPGQGWWPKFVQGWYDVGGTRLYIGHGIGTSGPPVRFLAQAEVALITVTPQR